MSTKELSTASRVTVNGLPRRDLMYVALTLRILPLEIRYDGISLVVGWRRVLRLNSVESEVD